MEDTENKILAEPVALQILGETTNIPTGALMKVTHLTSAHPRHDPRIFIKQCVSLAVHGYDVNLVVADDKGDEHRQGVRIYDVGPPSGRLNRMLKTTRLILAKAIALDSDVYHLHDPELLPIGVRLKRLGKAVIFDSHEDLPVQILTKPYLGSVSLNILSRAVAIYERRICRKFDGIVGATPHIRDKFLAINPRSVDVNNYPILGELESTIPWDAKHAEVSYIGNITAVRGIRSLVKANSFTRSRARMNLVGVFAEPDIEREVKTYPGWERVNQLGYLDRAGVREVLGRSMAGLVTLLPIPSYLDSLPVKMFEYMAAGIPVIGSNFKLWRDIIEKGKCGICVDPDDPRAIAEAIDHLVMNPELAKRMGENGRRLVVDNYNWNTESMKLLGLYSVVARERFEVRVGNGPAGSGNATR
jgi:glycosyltransferase involved in cell wall biosynthesis